MNKQDIIRIARESGLAYGSDENILPSVLHFFMAAYEAGISTGIAVGTVNEREACAKICDNLHHDWRFGTEPESISGPRECASAIRSRGK